MQLCTQKYITSCQRGMHLHPPYPPWIRHWYHLKIRNVWVSIQTVSVLLLLFLTKDTTVKALNKVPLKNNYDPQRRLVRSAKNYRYSRPLGAPCLERRLRIRAQLRPFLSDLQRPSYNRSTWSVGCGLALKYVLIVAAVVSEVEIIQQQSMN